MCHVQQTRLLVSGKAHAATPPEIKRLGLLNNDISHKRLENHFTVFGGYSVGVTPVPIPNTEVKSYRADDTAWETVWESRSLPKLFENPHPILLDGGFFVV